MFKIFHKLKYITKWILQVNSWKYNYLRILQSSAIIMLRSLDLFPILHIHDCITVTVKYMFLNFYWDAHLWQPKWGQRGAATGKIDSRGGLKGL